MYPSILQQRDVANFRIFLKIHIKIQKSLNTMGRWFSLIPNLKVTCSQHLKHRATNQTELGKDFPSRKQLKLMLPQASYPTGASIPMVIKVTWTAPVSNPGIQRDAVPSQVLLINSSFSMDCNAISFMMADT
jgi:hypothetical protein